MDGLAAERSATAIDGNQIVQASSAVITGKRYWEVYIDRAPDTYAYGINTGAQHLGGSVNVALGSNNSNGAAYVRDGRKYHYSISAYGPSFGQGDVIGVAIDKATGSIWFAKNGVWIGDPEGGTEAAFSGINSGLNLVPAVGLSGTNKVIGRFDEQAWQYAAPAGFSALLPSA